MLSILKAQFKASLEYRFAFFLNIFTQLFAYGVTIFNMTILLRKFKQINGWSFHEIIFLFILDLFSYGVSSFFVYASSRQIENLVQSGEFDGLLIRPLHPLVHLLVKHLSPMFIAHVLLSASLFIFFFKNFPIVWNSQIIVFFILVLLGSILIQASIMLICGSISFWLVKSVILVNTALYGLKNFIVYPISIYNTFVQILLTCIIPYAFINFYPAHYFFNKDDTLLFHPYLQFGTPIVGVILFTAALFIWHKGLNMYQSTGT